MNTSWPVAEASMNCESVGALPEVMGVTQPVDLGLKLESDLLQLPESTSSHWYTSPFSFVSPETRGSKASKKIRLPFCEMTRGA